MSSSAVAGNAGSPGASAGAPAPVEKSTRERVAELARLHPLPSPRGVALEMLKRSQRDDVSIGELARLAQADPALAGRLVKAANSALLGARRPAGSVQEAILRTGVPAAARLALAFSLIGDHGSGACAAFDYRRFWTGSLLRGLASQALAVRLGASNPEEMFCCGLLAQVGRLGFATAYGDAYGAVLRQPRSAEGPALRLLERERFALDHAELTCALLEDWGFPAMLRQAIEGHFAPEDAAHDGGPRVHLLSRLLQIADHVALAGVGNAAEKAAQTAHAARHAAHVGIDPATLGTLASEIERESGEWSALLQVPPPLAPLLEFDPGDAAPGGHDPGPQVLEGAGARVLVIDGDRTSAASIARLLGQGGYRASVAHDGAEALSAFLVRRPQALVVDWHAPGIDGAALCRALRATAAGAGLYVIMLAPGEDPGRDAAALNAGADDLMRKPVDNRVLLARLGAGLRARRRHEQFERDMAEMHRFARELAVSNRKLQGVSTVDPETGLPNRRYALERIEQECSAAQRRRAPITCILIEPDRPVGASAGNAGTLKALASLLRAAARRPDVLCRFGAEELILIAPDTDRVEGLAVADRLRAQAGAAWNATISVGLASEAFGGCTPAELVRRAEEALLRCRKSGGNCVAEYVERLRKAV